MRLGGRQKSREAEAVCLEAAVKSGLVVVFFLNAARRVLLFFQNFFFSFLAVIFGLVHRKKNYHKDDYSPAGVFICLT